MASIKELPLQFQRRVINDSTLPRFEWSYHNFSTEYVEPFDVSKAGENQTSVLKQFVLPQRKFTLEFPTMFYIPDSEDMFSVNEYKQISMTKLEKFYNEQGLTGKFIYNHPVYGDCVCRFSKELEIPQRNPSGRGTIQAFSIELNEIITQDYFLDINETLIEDSDLEFKHGLVTVKYSTNDAVIALGNNYQMAIKSEMKKLRVFTITLPTMLYWSSLGQLNYYAPKEINMFMLELMYLKYRLKDVFNFRFNGEVIPVKFNQALSIPKLKGNKGFTEELTIELRESPYAELKEI